MARGTFATAINCMDGRVQEPVIQWMKERFEVDFVDMVTEPGPDRVLVSGSIQEKESIRRRVGISVDAHRSRVVAVVAHHDCAGHPVSRARHIEALTKSVAEIKLWHVPVRLITLWIGDTWQVELIFDSRAGEL